MRGRRGGRMLRWSGASFALPTNTVAPAISGTMQIGSTLTSTTGTWSGRPGAFTYTYQWKRAGVNIAAATNSTYVLVAADIGPAITCSVTATNSAGATAAASNALTYTFANDANIREGLLGSQYVSGTSWPTIKGLGTATLNDATHVTATTLAGKAALHFDGNAAGFVTITGLGATISTQSGASVFTVMKTTQATVATVWEYISTANMTFDVHDTDTAEVLPNATYWSDWNTPDPGTAAAAWSCHFDRTVLSGIAGVRRQGATVTLHQHGTAGTPGGNFASGNWRIGSNLAGSLPCNVDLSIWLVTTAVLAPTGNPALTIEAALSFYGGV